MLQQTNKQQRNNFYRSIQYRSASFDTKINKLNINTQRLPVFQLKKPQTSKIQSRKSNRNLFRSQQNIKNFNKTLSQSLSKAKQIQLNSTLISQSNPQDQIIQNFGTCSYIESFQQLMQIEAKNSYKKKKISPMTIKLSSLKTTNKIDRISLPNIIQYQNSQFTALDPIRLPIIEIKQNIQKTRKNIQDCPQKLKAIRCEIRDFKQRNIKQIESFSDQFSQSIKKLWGKLRQNSVYQQGFVMRIKRQLNDLENFIPQFKAQFQTTQNNQFQLQTVIFETAPFQLKRNVIEKQSINEKQNSLMNIDSLYF